MLIIVNELGYEVRLYRWRLRLYRDQGGTIFNGSRNVLPCCRRAEGTNQWTGQVWYLEKFLG